MIVIVGGSVGGSGLFIVIIIISFGFGFLYYKNRSKLNSSHDILLKLFIENNKKGDSLLPNADNRPSVSYYLIHY